MRNFIVAVLLFAINSGQAQQLTPQSINTAGNSSTAPGILLESETGGFVVTSFYGTTYLYTQGFLQPNAGTTATIATPPKLGSTLGVGLTNAGTTSSNGNIMLEFTTGEYACITLSNPNNLLTQGILQPYENAAVLPVTGLEFYAKRVNETTVVLDWKTLTEINNKGFTVERRKDNENSFGSIGFVSSKANGGNSSVELNYQKTDNNSFAGKSYYRIKQEDLNGLITYSVIRVVNGNNNTAMQVWPVPSSGPVNVLVNGIATNDKLMVLDMSGRLVQQLPVQNNTTLQLKSLPAGTYLVQLASTKDIIQKVVVQ